MAPLLDSSEVHVTLYLQQVQQLLLWFEGETMKPNARLRYRDRWQEIDDERVWGLRGQGDQEPSNTLNEVANAAPRRLKRERGPRSVVGAVFSVDA